MPGNSFRSQLVYSGNRILDFILHEYHGTCCPGFFNVGNVHLFGNNNQADAVWISSRLFGGLGNPFPDFSEIFSNQRKGSN
jgi:hypothetical protein